MRIKSRLVFLESVARDFKRTGAVAPSSKALANAMCRELARRYKSPARVLEVGGGTGSITEEILRHLSCNDHLDVYEIDRELANILNLRLKEDVGFRHTEASIRVHNRPIETIDRHPQYDFIISCLPFTNFDPNAVRDIFEIFRAILKPKGICSFYEYIFVRKAAKVANIVSGKAAERKRVGGVAQVVKEYISRYGFGHEVVLRNLPPAMVQHICFNR